MGRARLWMHFSAWRHPREVPWLGRNHVKGIADPARGERRLLDIAILVGCGVENSPARHSVSPQAPCARATPITFHAFSSGSASPSGNLLRKIMSRPADANAAFNSS